jgi:oxygen-independent coproporphyrinogen-3 oxidase
MAGIYLHIPFCKQACHYCNFHFSTSLKRKNDFVVALLREIELRAAYIGGETVETIYFGGGTPSLLDPGELEKIMESLYAHFSIAPEAEITLEANPDDIDDMLTAVPRFPRKLQVWKKAGINRLSIGVQSFFEEDLRWMNRSHTSGQALAAIRLTQEQGFDNISIDLIYGGPTMSDERWNMNLDQALSLGIPHLSCYALTVEPRTALDQLIRRKKVDAVDPERQARQFLLLMDRLARENYDQYEISNFARPGRRSRHNSSYWQGVTYLGLGPSAHSFNGESRQWNVPDNGRYIDSLGSDRLPFEKEQLTGVQQLNEYIMISLRTLEGCDLQKVSARFGKNAALDLALGAKKFIVQGKIESVPGEIGEGRLSLTREGKLLADGIAADLFFAEPQSSGK